MQNEQRLGENWIIEQLHTLASEHGLQIDVTEWSDARDFTRLLIASLRGKRVMETFTLGELEDLAGHEATQVDVRRRLHALITQTLPR